jgi:hypothetical protein
MAKVVFGQGVSKISGRIGGTVYANNRGGSYMRNFVPPTNPRSTAQVDQRTMLGNRSALWRTLTTAQQDAWSSWAETHPITDRLGASITLTGAQAYCWINVNRELASDTATAHTVPPSDPTFIASAIDSAYDALAITGTHMDLQAAAILPINTVLFVWAAPPVSPGVSFTFDKERLIAVTSMVAEVAVGAIAFNAWTTYTARFGALTGLDGKKIICRTHVYSEGQTSQGFVTTGILAA